MVPVMDDLLPGMLDLARDGGETLTRQLTDQLRTLINGGRLAPGVDDDEVRAAAHVRERVVLGEHLQRPLRAEGGRQ